MQALRAWLMAIPVFTRYFLYRAGLARRPRFTDYYPEYQAFCGSILHWDRRTRIVGAEHCPRGGPAVFAANHVRLSDPLYIFRAVTRASEERLYVRFMARDDFFNHWAWRFFPFRPHDMLEMGGACFISRGGARPAQLKPLLDLLEAREAFLMFPGGTRSRSGVLIEYGGRAARSRGVAFFLAQTQAKHPDWRVPAVPLVRTFDPARHNSVVVFGPPVYLEPEAGREQQRAFDEELAARLGGLVEIHATHVVSALLYLWCLHGRGLELTKDALCEACRRVRDNLQGRHVHPGLIARLEGEVRGALRYLRRRGMVRVKRGSIFPKAARILDCPPLDTAYRKRNPVRFFANQLLHLPDVTRAIESAAAALREDAPRG